MINVKKRWWAGMAALAGVFWCAGPALAQSWPDRTVRMIIPFPPGGTLDKVGRMLAQRLGHPFQSNFQQFARTTKI